jgi:hypothetical protein
MIPLAGDGDIAFASRRPDKLKSRNGFGEEILSDAYLHQKTSWRELVRRRRIGDLPANVHVNK